MSVKNKAKKILGMITQSNWYPNKRILLESNPDLGSQTEPLFHYMLEKGLNSKYKITWMVWDKEKYKDVHIKNVNFINFYPTTRFEGFQRFYYLLSSRAMIYSHRYIGKIYDKQILMFLRHGSFIKSRLLHAKVNEVNESDAVVSMGEFFTAIEEQQLKINRNRLIFTGYPTNDYLWETVDYTKKLFPEYEFDKVIIWLPTFRKHYSGERIDSNHIFPLGIPCIYSNEQCAMVNEELHNKNVLLVIKPHPAQDMSVIRNLGFSNIVFMSDEDIQKCGIHLYQLLPSTDAMITDYSSIYYDYLLVDKPIGITIDDIDDYEADTGFVFDNFYDVIVGEYMKDYKDLISFIQNVSAGKDIKKTERAKTRDMVYKYQDNHSTERVYNELMRLIHERYKD